MTHICSSNFYQDSVFPSINSKFQKSEKMGSEYIYTVYTTVCLMNRYTLFDYLIFIYCTVYIYLAGRRVLCVYISHEHDVQNSISV